MSRRNEWNETLDETITRSRAQGGLLVYSMAPEEVIEVGISGRTPEGIDIEQSRNITARALGIKNGALEILDDTAEIDNCRGKVICLGSYAFNIAGVQFSSPGLLRGFIAFENGVVVDQSASHFTGEIPPTYLMAEYSDLILEDQVIF